MSSPATAAASSSLRPWYFALGLTVVAALFQVGTALHALGALRDQGMHPSLVVWSGVPAIFATPVLLFARGNVLRARLAALFILLANIGAAAIYVWGYWLGYESADPAFMFIFTPLFQSGAILVGGSFALLLASIPRTEP